LFFTIDFYTENDKTMISHPLSSHGKDSRPNDFGYKENKYILSFKCF